MNLCTEPSLIFRCWPSFNVKTGVGKKDAMQRDNDVLRDVWLRPTAPTKQMLVCVSLDKGVVFLVSLSFLDTDVVCVCV